MKRLLIAILMLLGMAMSADAATEVTLEAKITGLYVAYFNRAADEGGLTYWRQRGEEAKQKGEEVSSVLKQLSAGFALHPSFARAYGDMDNKTFVEAVYRNTLGREGDAEGVAYWTALLKNGLSRSDFVSIFVEAALTFDRNDPKYNSLSQEELDAAQLRQDLITNKVEVALAFTHQLGTLSNVTNNNNPESDPAYLASIKIISSVNENHATVEEQLQFLESIVGSENPVADIVGENTGQKDMTAPSITLEGSNPMTLYVGETFSDPGASANDDVDGVVAVSVTGQVNVDAVGSYTIVYSASDSSGNIARKERIVNVIAHSEWDSGKWDELIWQ